MKETGDFNNVDYAEMEKGKACVLQDNGVKFIRFLMRFKDGM